MSFLGVITSCRTTNYQTLNKMSFLGNKKLKSILDTHIVPFDETKIKCGAYELALGNEYFTTNAKDKVKKTLKEGEQFTIEPGQFALLITKEVVRIPNNNLAFISIKAGIKFSGLVNVSGFHVDPGFHGKLKFSVYNAGSKDIVLTEGQKLFPIWFSEFSETLDDNEVYKGNFQNQNAINGEDVMRITGEVLSSNVLNEKLKEYQKNLIIFQSILTISTTILIAIGSKYFWENRNYDSIQEKQIALEQKIDSLSQLVTNNIKNDTTKFIKNDTTKFIKNDTKPK
jgi:deoxycytidine triphosphate deaminase